MRAVHKQVHGHSSGDFFYWKSTIGTTIAAIEANNDTYCLQKRIEKFPLRAIYLDVMYRLSMQ